MGQRVVLGAAQSASSSAKGRCTACLAEMKGSGYWRAQKNKMPENMACDLCHRHVRREHGKMTKACDPECPKSDGEGEEDGE